MHKILWDFEIQMDYLNLARRQYLILIDKKRICQLVDFAILADYRVKINESEKIDKYLDLARELKKLWNMRFMVILIVIDVL